MQPEIKSIQSPDVWDLESWTPTTNNWSVLLEVLIGPKGVDAEDSFDLLIGTPEWLAEEANKTEIVDGRHTYIVTSWNWANILRYIERRVSSIEEDTWNNISNKLSRLGNWAFEDYQEHDFS
jgi:hypothetical protein